MTPRERNIILVLTVLVFVVVVIAAITLLPSGQPAPTPATTNLVVTAEAEAVVTTFDPAATVAPELRPNDPYFDRQWYLRAIGAPEAWPNLAPDQPQVIVAVIDSGICANHPDLEGRIVPGVDLINEPSPREIAGDDFVIDRPLPDQVAPLEDAANHGCAMANIIAANTNNAIGIAGIAPNAVIMPIKVLDSTGNGTVEMAADAIRYAVDNGAGVINLSLSLNPGSTDAEIAAITDAVNYANERGIPIVASAGNTYGGPARMPAAFDSVIAVGALTESLQPTETSAAQGIDVWAPGEAILSASIFAQNGQLGFEEFEGASIAAAIVSGVLAANGTIPTRIINDLPVVYMGG
jgi:subtilisin family serine protease